MDRFSLPILSILAFLALSPVAASAQAPTASPTLYAESGAPTLFSSSSISNDFAAPVSEAPAAASAADVDSAAAASSDYLHPFSAVGVGFKIGIGGIGFDVATPLWKRLNLRGGAGFFSYTYNGTVNNEPVNANLKLNNAELMVDYFPFNGGFRLSAGTTLYNNTGLNGTLSVTAGNKITIGNTSYTSSPSNPIAGTLASSFGGNAVPRFTLGWGNMVPRTGHIRFEVEAGIDVIGTPKVAWTFTGQGCTTNCSSSEPSYGAIAPSDIAAQNASLQSDLNGFKVFPILSIGLSYKIGSSH